MQPGKLIALYFVIAIMVLQTMSMPLAYLNFQINRDYIAETLCVNKNEPITICGGTCYLSKSIKKAHDNPESDKPAQTKKQVTETLYCLSTFEFTCNQIQEATESKFIYKETVTSSFPKDIFHPPRG